MSRPLSKELILSQVKKRAVLRRVKALGGIAMGVPLCLIGPLVLASMFWIAIGSLFGQWYPWIWFFGVLLVITLPLMIHTELRTRGDYLGTVARDPGVQVPGSEAYTIAVHLRFGAEAGMAASLVTNPRLTSAGLTEIFLTGPRMLVGGVRLLRQEKELNCVNVERASEVLAKLSSIEQGMPLSELTQRGESRADLVPVLCFLLFYGWIGVAEKSDRAFLYTESRDLLTTKS